MTGEQQRTERRHGGRHAPERKGTWTGPDSEFINRELNVEETGQYRAWREDVDDVARAWGELCEAGYKINTKYDDYSRAFAAYIIPGPDSENGGFILTGRGGSPYRAVAEAIFKHEVVFRGSWSVASKGPDRVDDPDF